MKNWLKWVLGILGIVVLLVLFDLCIVCVKKTTPLLAIHGKDSDVYYAFGYKVWECEKENVIGSYFKKYACPVPEIKLEEETQKKNEDTSSQPGDNDNINPIASDSSIIFNTKRLKEDILAYFKAQENLENKSAPNYSPKIVPDKLTMFEITNARVIQKEKNDILILYTAKFSCDDKIMNSCLYFTQADTTSREENYEYDGMAYYRYNEQKKTYELNYADTNSAGWNMMNEEQ